MSDTHVIEAAVQKCPRCCTAGTERDVIGGGLERPDTVRGCRNDAPCAWAKTAPDQTLEDHDMVVIADDNLMVAVTQLERAVGIMPRRWLHFHASPACPVWVRNNSTTLHEEVCHRLGTVSYLLAAKKRRTDREAGGHPQYDREGVPIAGADFLKRNWPVTRTPPATTTHSPRVRA